MLSYALVTPARNEAENLGRLGACLAAQTVPPSEWVIVDDGSTDDTNAVGRSLAAANPWVRLLGSPGAGGNDPLGRGRRTGRDIVAFSAGVEALHGQPDLVVKLDADVSFEPDFFERLLAEFDRDPRLGIASGTCWELEDGEWRPYHVTRQHVRGATRAYRRACFEAVGPLDERIGWDVVDEARANLLGWTTRSLPDLAFYHHRRLGERDGGRGTWEAQGQLAYTTGYRFSYMLMRALFRSRREPAAFAMVLGYAGAARRRERRAEPAVRAYLRRRQRLRALPRRALEAVGRTR